MRLCSGTLWLKDVHLRDLATPSPQLSLSELTANGFVRLLNAVAHFNYFLDKKNPLHPYAGDVQLEMWLLEQGDTLPRPLKEEIIFRNDEAKILASDENEYAFVIHNTGTTDLYPYIIYFDTSNYEVNLWWSPSDDHPPLPAGKRLQIGASPEQQTTFEPFVPDGQWTDTSIIKVIIAESPIKLDFIVQEAQVGTESTAHTTRGSSEKSTVMPLGEGAWDSITRKITVHDRD